MKIRLASLLLFGLFHTGITQPSFTYEDILGMIGNETVMRSDTTGSIPVDVGSAGENQTWDFSSFTIPDGFDIIYRFKDPAGSPFEAYFPTANFVLEEEFSDDQFHFLGYSYHYLKPSSFDFLGYAYMDTVSGYSDIDLESEPDHMDLPIEYGQAWTNVNSDTSDEIAGSTFIFYDSTVSEIDAWGTISTPAGSFECLRIRDTYYEINTYYFNDILIFADSSTGINYEFIGPEAMIFASIESMDGETDPGFSTAQSVTVIQDTQVVSIFDTPRENSVNGFNLAQNYPNPFNSRTVFSFYLPQAGDIDLSVYDTSGKRVASLVSGRQAAGSHRVSWNAENLSSGVYFYRLVSGEHIITKKCMLIK